MSKYGMWKKIEGEKRIPLRVIFALSREEILKIISIMLKSGEVPNNKTQIMNLAYEKLGNRDFNFSEYDINPLAEKMFDKYFKDYKEAV